MQDTYGRTIDYMRVSITDRCNLRCRYCMPKEVKQTYKRELLSYEEILRVCKAAAKNGIRKIKVTGGEPLLRSGCVDFIKRLKEVPGIEVVTLTTNGILLAEYAEALKESQVDGINISIDSLKPEVYEQITGSDYLKVVLEGMKEAMRYGIPVKFNTVLQKGVNDKEWEALLEIAKNYPVDIRFIEMMPIGYGRDFSVIDNNALLEKIRSRYPGIHRDLFQHGNGPAEYYRILGFRGCVGFISAIHGKFCGSCNRIRLTAEGRLKPCLCYDEAEDVRYILRNQGKVQLEKAIRRAIYTKPCAHHFEGRSRITERGQMVKIGG